jgi:hypothetical protein
LKEFVAGDCRHVATAVTPCAVILRLSGEVDSGLSPAAGSKLAVLKLPMKLSVIAPASVAASRIRRLYRRSSCIA